MRVSREIFDLRDFEWWAGAKDNFNDLLDNPEEYEYIQSYLECFDDIDETVLNDWMWFDVPEILREAYDEGYLGRKD